MTPSKESKNKPKTPFLKHWMIIAILLGGYDVLTANLSYVTALWARYDFSYTEILRSGPEYFNTWLLMTPVFAFAVVLTYALCRLYNSIWRFASFNELLRTLAATFLSWTIQVIGTILILSVGKGAFVHMPWSYYLGGIILQFMFAVGIRFSYRFVLLLRNRRGGSGDGGARVMIVGAGNAGRALYTDIMTAQQVRDKVICFIDDNPNKWNRYVERAPVLGGREKILEAAKEHKIDRIYIAIPSATNREKRDIVNICKESGLPVQILPSSVQIASGEVTVSMLRPVKLTDVLGREVISVNTAEVFNQLTGKCILVTGGGGSIGSELCRQIAEHNPRRLIVFDIYENNAFEIQQELRKKFPNLKLVTLIGSVRDSRRLEEVFKTYKPEIVFHAAAHKHVPLMEDSPAEAVKNNVIGTYKTAYAAIKYGTAKFVLISTDKAVHPTSIMGASKRMCEMVIQSMNALIREGRAQDIPPLFTHEDRESGEKDTLTGLPANAATDFAAVRFGNVLGSNGSVIPIFQKQIAEGGPVTVTHPDIVRYFMTIPEAVSLVLQASVYAHGGEIFVLDMGDPVKIDALARNMIRLSGLQPDVDIKIVYTGLRPGEKLYEEKLMAEEGIEKTENDLIFIGKPVVFDTEKFLSDLKGLMHLAYTDEEETRRRVMEMGGIKREKAAGRDKDEA